MFADSRCQGFHTCNNGCEAESRKGCQCDQLCDFFDDCCQDVSFCAANRSDDASTTSPTGFTKFVIGQQHVGCHLPILPNESLNNTSVFHQDPEFNGYLMVDTCSNLESAEFVKKCHEHNVTDLQASIPVSDATYGISFRNVYCALCNGVAPDDIVLWKLLAHCEEDILPLLQEGLANGLSITATLLVINDFCPITFGPPDTDAEQLTALRPCYNNAVGSGSCAATDASLQTALHCDGYTAYVVDVAGNVYRNPHCYFCAQHIDHSAVDYEIHCNGDNLPTIREILPPTPLPPIRPPVRPPERPVGGRPGFVNPEYPDSGVDPGLGGGIPGPDPIPTTPSPRKPVGGLRPISVIVDFSSGSGVSISIADTVVKVEPVACKEGQVYDPFADRCHSLTCSSGYMLVGDHCVLFASDTETDCNNSDSLISITLPGNHCGANEISDNEDLVTCLRNSYIPMTFIVKNESLACATSHTLFEFVVESPSSSFVDLEHSYDTIFLLSDDENTNGPTEIRCNISGFSLSQHCSAEGLLDCDNGTRSLSNVAVEVRNATTVLISENTTYALLSGGGIFLEYELSAYDDMDSRFTKLIRAEICNSVNVNTTVSISCSLVTLNASLFTNHSSTGDMLYEPTGDIYTPAEYIITPDGAIQVCSFLERNGTRNVTQTITFVAYDTSQVVLSLIGCIISMMALVATFVTFCAFSSLRTQAIQAIMNLVAALFAAQFVFLIGAGSTGNTNLCSFIAALSHYLWLCTFTWSTVLAYDLNKTFSGKLKLTSNQTKYAVIWRYLIYGWSTPLLVVIPCLILHSCACSNLPFSYGSEGACWIYNQYANLVVFGAPLAVCLVINSVFFFKVLWSIHDAKQKAKMVRQNKTEVQNIKEELYIYVKVGV